MIVTLRRAVLLLITTCLFVSAAYGDEWGTLKGRFVYSEKNPPAPNKVTPDKDEHVCGKHELFNEEFVVGRKSGVANVVVFVRDKNVKVHPDAAAAAKAEKVVLDNKNCRFEPHVAFVQAGQDLVVKNSDTVSHNSNIAALKNPPSNTITPVGKETTITFKAAEAIPIQVTCNIHPWMKAWLVVRDNPYAAVSGPDGSFEIANLPVGEVELQLWHEKAGYIGSVTVAGKAEETKKGRKKVKIAAAGTDLGEMVLDASLFSK